MQKAIKVAANKADKSILLSLDKPYFSLIWLHGLGDSSAGFLDFFQHPLSPVNKGARVKLLHAPIRPVTLNGGMKMTSWYDIKHLANHGTEEQRYSMNEIRESLGTIDKYVKEEIDYWKETGIKGNDEDICKRIFVGGFSQGCAMSLVYALSGDRIIGGVIGYSGHLIESFPLKNKEKVPMLMYHGDSDEVLPYEYTQSKYAKHLESLPNFKFKLIPDLPHSVVLDQLPETTDWMLAQLQSNKITPL